MLAGAVGSGFTLFVMEASNIPAEQVGRQLVVIAALRVNKCEFSVYNIQPHFYEICVPLRGSNNLLTLYQIKLPN